MVFRKDDPSSYAMGKAYLFKPGNKMAVGTVKPAKTWTPEVIEAEKEALIEWIEDEHNYFFTNYLNKRMISHQTVDWISSKDQEYKELVRLAKSVQEERLVDKGVNRKGDGNFIKFILSNKAGWKETQEHSHTLNPVHDIMKRIEDSHLDVTPQIEQQDP